jgi:phosphatidylglycerophosphate synthase
MLVIVSRVGRHHPFGRFGPANHVTLLRLILVAAVGALIGERPAVRAAWSAVGVTVVVAVLDGVDGWLARRSRVSSAFGARFDMETDALLILVLSVLVWQHGKAGPWVLACGAMRYAFVAAGWWLPWMAGPLRSTVRGKTVAIAQLVGLGVALSPLVSQPHSAIVATVTLAALTWSFAVDVAWLRRIAE